MKIGFIILSHTYPSQQFLRLLERISEFPEYEIGLHHDFGQSDFPQEVIDKYNIHLVKPHYATKWAHISKVPATLAAFYLLYNLPNPPDWYVTISPNCYPVKSTSHILNFLENTKYDVFMDANQIKKGENTVTGWHWKTLFTRPVAKIPFISRHGKFYWKVIRKEIDIKKTPFSEDFLPFTGADWFMFNHKAMIKMAEAKLESHPIINFMAEANSYGDMNCSPIEVIIITFFANLKGLNQTRDYYRYIDWENAKDWHPNTLTMRHKDAILASNALWARKFNNDSLELIEYLDKNVL